MQETPLLATVLLVTALAACQSPGGSSQPRFELFEIATSERQWTGLAVSSDARTFVNYPLWGADQPFAVGELRRGEVVPYPSEEWNDWQPGSAATDHFICVQALYCSGNQLWVLDPASPRFEGVVPGGPKLVVIDLEQDRVQRIYAFDESVAPTNSYLNDLRLDSERGLAYLTDSGGGALIVLDLASGAARRVLDEHPSTGAEGITLEIDGTPWLMNGSAPQIHADGIALDAEGGWLYYQALSGRHLYRVPTASLADASLGEEQLGSTVELVAEVGPSDGLLMGTEGAVWLTSLEAGAIQRVWPETGRIELISQDERISWPDSFAAAPDGSVWFTTAQIHRGTGPPEPYRILRLAAPE